MNKLLLLVSVFGIALSITKNDLNQDCFNQFCSNEIDACRRDSTCKKYIVDCYSNSMGGVNTENIQRSKAAYDLCLSQNHYMKVQSLYKCKTKNCATKLLIMV